MNRKLAVFGVLMMAAGLFLGYLGVLRSMHELQMAQAKNEAALARNQQKLLRLSGEIQRFIEWSRRPASRQFVFEAVDLETVVAPNEGWVWLYVVLALLLFIAGSGTALSAVAPGGPATPEPTLRRSASPAQVETHLEELEGGGEPKSA